MKIDCQWIESKLEGFFCEQLTADESRQFLNHVESCSNCRQQVSELKSVDLLVKRFFRHELAAARAPRRIRWSALAGAAAAALAAGFAIVVLLHPSQQIPPTPLMSQAPPPALVATTTQSEATGVPKAGSTEPQDRAKPEPGSPDNVLNPTPTAPAAQPPDNNAAADFVVTDPAGYALTLRDYRNYVLIFGVWNSKQPHTVATLQKIYETFGPNTKLRILGVAMRRQQKPASATFPVAFNQGSKLLGIKEGEFAVVSNGNVIFHASLLADTGNIVASIHSVLTKLNP